MLLTISAAAAAGAVPMPAFAEDAGARPVTEKDVLVKTADGSADAALFYPKGKGKWPAVLMWPDILGLRPVFREMGKRLAAQGYVVLVPNPYYRAKKAPVVEGAFDFGSKDDMNKIMAFKNGVDRRRWSTAIPPPTSPSSTRSRRPTRRRKAGVQGYCMSGPIAFRTAAARPDRIGAVATFHPGALVTDKPSSPHLLIPRTQGRLPGDHRQERCGEDAEGKARSGCRFRRREAVRRRSRSPPPITAGPSPEARPTTRRRPSGPGPSYYPSIALTSADAFAARRAGAREKRHSAPPTHRTPRSVALPAACESRRGPGRFRGPLSSAPRLRSQARVSRGG